MFMCECVCLTATSMDFQGPYILYPPLCTTTLCILTIHLVIGEDNNTVASAFYLTLELTHPDRYFIIFKVVLPKSLLSPTSIHCSALSWLLPISLSR